MDSIKCFNFDGTMLVSGGNIKYENKILNVVAFEQTNTKRNIGEEYSDVKIKPELYFIFHSKKAIDAVIKVLEHLKCNFMEV